ncbi:MAG: DUF6138 family protein, partial [Spirochaetes bacterium]|nr:DUF6138 family protein [Spirochaetota bacterium]
ASYHCVTANRIFGFVTAMGSGLPDRMKKHGSGEMPKELLSCEDAGLSCKANDAFATIKITVKEEAEGHYAKALDFLIRLLPAGFPRSYGIEFKSPDKNYLAVKGLPKKSVNQFFANAARYESLHGKIAHYAKSAMRQFEQYTNLGDEECAMPGSFAVFAIGLCDAADTPHAPLVIEYFKLCDDEHSSIQGKFLAAYIAKFGLSEKTLDVFFAGIDSMQEQGPQYSKVYAEAFANEASLRLLLSRKKDFDDCRWNKVLHSIFGREALAGGGTGVVKKAPAGLRALYGEIFA